MQVEEVGAPTRRRDNVPTSPLANNRTRARARRGSKFSSSRLVESRIEEPAFSSSDKKEARAVVRIAVELAKWSRPPEEVKVASCLIVSRTRDSLEPSKVTLSKRRALKDAKF
jgi:hypothetical protein